MSSFGVVTATVLQSAAPMLAGQHSDADLGPISSAVLMIAHTLLLRLLATEAFRAGL